MLIPRHWSPITRTCTLDGRPQTLKVWGWSQSDAQAATRDAEQKADSIVARILGRGQRAADYQRPIREEIERVLADGPVRALTTWNRYGSLILNVDRLPIIDIDLPAAGGGGLFARLFGGKPKDPRQEILDRIQGWAGKHGDLAARWYATRNGFRVIIVNRLLDPCGAEAGRIFAALGADKLYGELCRRQDCYRARLTPKPWRIGLKRPPFPFLSDEAGAAAANVAWRATYLETCKGRRACELVGSSGGAGDPQVAGIVKFHDELAGGGAGELV